MPAISPSPILELGTDYAKIKAAFGLNGIPPSPWRETTILLPQVFLIKSLSTGPYDLAYFSSILSPGWYLLFIFFFMSIEEALHTWLLPRIRVSRDFPGFAYKLLTKVYGAVS